MFFFKLRQLKKNTKKIVLNSSEKELMRNNIISFMKENPVRKTHEARHNEDKTEPLFVFSLIKQKYMFGAIAAIVLALLGGSVSYAAEGSYPGQPLYNVKHFNEAVREVLAVTPEAKADWNEKRIERRLDEATTLASNGTLTTSTEQILATAIETHLKKASERLNELEKKGKSEKAEELGKRLEDALNLHEKLLLSFREDKKLQQTTSTPKISQNTTSTLHNTYEDSSDDENEMGDDKNSNRKNTLVHQIHKEANEIRKITNKLEKIIHEEQKNESAANGKIQAATNKIDEVTKYLGLKSVSISSETNLKAKNLIALASTELATAKTKLTEKKYDESFEHAKKAHRVAEQVKVLIKTQEKLDRIINVGKILNEIEKREEHKIKFATSTFSTTTLPRTSTSSTISSSLENRAKLDVLKKEIQEIKKDEKIEKKKFELIKKSENLKKEIEKKEEKLKEFENKIER